uniref:Uncharacterized protein n=2 Tax=Meloidogyne TaxID=189290 RepID=A0A6V7UEL3_MELEN|nr:unnamed protein product [Meloidogyne enterolobii]CAD2178812.1 unnamed protein product [Meloidogyne enterolobii]
MTTKSTILFIFAICLLVDNCFAQSNCKDTLVTSCARLKNCKSNDADCILKACDCIGLGGPQGTGFDPVYDRDSCTQHRDKYYKKNCKKQIKGSQK